jgi:hypothetical protein
MKQKNGRQKPGILKIYRFAGTFSSAGASVWKSK